jgi:protein O-mannosyl-transferase
MVTHHSQERLKVPNNNAMAVGVCAVLVAAVLLVFGQTVRYDFVNYDDDLYFTANSHVQAGLTWRGTAWAFSTGYNGNWHPLTWLSFMLDVALWGTGPTGPHLTNLLLHAANTALLFLLSTRLTGALWRSALVAALFGMHPLHVESVAWVSERKDVLSGVFFMLTLLCYAKAVTSNRYQGGRASGAETFNIQHSSSNAQWWYWSAVVLFALGLMSKPMLVTVPFVLLLLDFWPLQRFSRSTVSRLFLEKIPFLLLSALVCVATILSQPHNGIRLERTPLDWRIENAVATCFIYLGKMVYPAGLTVFYPYSAAGLSAGKTCAGVILIAGICLGFFSWRRKRPYFLVGWLWYLGMLVPVLGLIQISRHARADRYTYLPLIGIFILLAWAAGELFPRWRQRRQTLGVAAAFALAALTVGTVKQASYWRNSESLWVHALACTENNYIAHNNLGLALEAQGNSLEAGRHYEKAIEINPSFVEAHNNFGIWLARGGQSMEAARQFQKAIELQPDCAAAYSGLGNVLADQGQWAEAIANYEKAIGFDPDFAAAQYNLGNALALQGRFAEAIGHFQKALQLRPDDAKTRQSLDAALALQAQSAEDRKKQ